jgi:restriction endonuclease S subunit
MSADSQTGALPKSWEQKCLGDLVRLKYGKALEKSRRDEGGAFPVVGSAGIMTYTNEPLISGEVIVVGRKGNVGEVQIFKKGVWPIDTVFFFPQPNGLNLDYFYWHLTSLEMKKLDSSTSTPSLRREDLEAVRIGIPPVAEQEKIVEILEEQLSRLDVALASIRAAREKSVRFRRSLLHAAFTGALTGHDTSDGTLPESWQVSCLGDVAKWGSGGTPKATNPAFYDGDIPWAVIGDLNDGLVEATATSITRAGLEASSAKLIPAGTLLIAMYGSIGKLGIAGVELATNQAIAFATPDERIVTSRFLFNYLAYQKETFLSSGKGMTQQNISQSILKSWPMPLPPLDVQVKVVEILEEQLSRLDASLAVADVIEKKASALRRSLLHAAFSGNLTKEWREGADV